MSRGTSNTNARGSAANRRARRLWLLSPAAGYGGNGATVPCYRAATHCNQWKLTYASLQVDRIVPGVLGGTYRRENIRPACIACNHATGTVLRERIRRGELNPVVDAWTGTGSGAQISST